MSIEAMKKALWLLEDFVDDPRAQKEIDETSAVLRQAIAEAEKQKQDGSLINEGTKTKQELEAHWNMMRASYAAQPKREWVGLTYEDMIEIWNNLYKERTDVMPLPTTFGKAIEAKLKELNI